MVERAGFFGWCVAITVSLASLGCSETPSRSAEPPDIECESSATDTILMGAENSFGMCSSHCLRSLSIKHGTTSGSCHTVTLDVSTRGSFEFSNRASLTKAGDALARSLTENLVDLPLDARYGCPDCADGGASRVTMTRQGVESSHSYEYSHPPAELAPLDEFVQGLFTALLACESAEHLELAELCTSLQ